MHKQPATYIILLTLLIATINTITYASTAVGVKSGDWIDYQVTITGNAPTDHNATWAKMEITNVQGTLINLNITSTMADNSFLQEQLTLNLEAGILGDDFIIPANLQTGDTFYDSHQGNITIAGTKQATVAGAERTIIYGSTAETTYFWDQPTGVLIEANTILTAYNMTTKAYKTNMWQQQTPDITTITIAVIIIVLVIATASLILVRHRKKGTTT